VKGFFEKRKMSSDKNISNAENNGKYQFPKNGADTLKPKITLLAKISFISGMSIIPIEGLSVIIVKTVIGDELLELLGVILIFFSLILLLVSVVSGIAALIRIAFNRKRFCGWILATAGIIVSIASFVIYGRILINDMFEHMMA
jgi:hypothetical protein